MLSFSGPKFALLCCLIVACFHVSSVDAKRGKGPEVLTPLPAPTNVMQVWAIAYLNWTRAAFPGFSPPAVGRMLAMMTTSAYDAWTAYDSIALPVYTANEVRVTGATAADIDAAVQYAMYCTTLSVFSRFPLSLLAARSLMQAQGLNPDDFTSSGTTPAAIGNHACATVLTARRNDGFNEFGDAPGSKIPGRAYVDYTNYEPVNKGQTVPGITNCANATQINSINKWQPLLVEQGLLPGWSDGTVQTWLASVAACGQPFALTSPAQFRPAAGPPRFGATSPTQQVLFTQTNQIVSFSANLTDFNKMVAEFWADGPDSTLPPGHWHLLTLDATIQQGLNLSHTIKLLFLQANAVLDGGIACWECKRFYDSVRPLQLVQCLLGQGTPNATAWRGPYLGVGNISLAVWKPYQDRFFVTPPFAGYVSGHSTFSSASAYVLRNFLGSDTYLGPTYVIRRGESLFEPSVYANDTVYAVDYMAGLTDVPNTGPNTVGFSPASDITFSWSTWTEAANQAGLSRLYGGIHIWQDNIDGLTLGDQVGAAVYAKATSLFAGVRPGTAQPTPCTSGATMLGSVCFFVIAMLMVM